MMQELAQLDEIQLRQCMFARKHSKTQQKLLEASNERLQEALSLLIDLPQEDKTEETILNISELYMHLLAPGVLFLASCVKCNPTFIL